MVGKRVKSFFTAKWFKPALGILHRPLDAVLPSPCPGCGLTGPKGFFCAGCQQDWLMQGEVWCTRCQQPLGGCGQVSAAAPDQGPDQSLCRALYYVSDYTGPPATLVKQFKYHRNLALVRPFSHLMARSLAPYRPDLDAITWMPLHPIRHRMRGFNQAELLARGLGRQLRLPVMSMLERSGATPPLEGLSRSERARVLHGAITARTEIKGKVLLVDDVFTTGASFNTAAEALVQAGAVRVDGAVLARTPLTEDSPNSWLGRSFGDTLSADPHSDTPPHSANTPAKPLV